jgi:hypothetical protein
MTPLFVLLFNVTVLRHHDQWELGKLEHFRLAARWVAGSATTDTSPSVIPPAFIGGAAMSVTKAASTELVANVSQLAAKARAQHAKQKPGASTYFKSAVHALEPVPLILMLIGAIGWPHLLLRREHLVLSAICVSVMAGVWVRQVTLGEINGRYFLACFFPASGAAGLGTLWVLARLERSWNAFAKCRGAAIVTASVATVIGFAHVADAVEARHPSREKEAAMGLRLREQLGSGRRFLVLPQACRVGYYASGRLPAVALDDTPLELLLERHHSDTVILERDYTPAELADRLAVGLEQAGWTPVKLDESCDADRFVVLTRPTGLAMSTLSPTTRRETR